jgi:hypothetical protein
MKLAVAHPRVNVEVSDDLTARNATERHQTHQSLSFRAGAGRPGTISLNDPSRPSNFSNPLVEITDSQ